jgi:hypothetical protein
MRSSSIVKISIGSSFAQNVHNGNATIPQASRNFSTLGPEGALTEVSGKGYAVLNSAPAMPPGLRLVGMLWTVVFGCYEDGPAGSRHASDRALLLTTTKHLITRSRLLRAPLLVAAQAAHRWRTRTAHRQPALIFAQA